MIVSLNPVPAGFVPNPDAYGTGAAWRPAIDACNDRYETRGAFRHRIGNEMTEPGAESGLKKLYLLHRAELTRFLIARTGNREEAEDLIQELWVKLETVPAGPIANGRAYLFRMAHNLVLDKRREQGRRARREQLWSGDGTGSNIAGEEIVDFKPNVDDLLAEKEDTARMIAAIASLPEGAQRVFRLHVIESVSHAEIAARLGISKSGVEKHMAVAIKHLRRALADRDEGQ